MTPSLRKIKEAARAATPGPWYVDQDNRPGMSWNRAISQQQPRGVDICQLCHSGGKDTKRDAATATHIANMDPTTVLALVAVVEAARAWIDSPTRGPEQALREALKGIGL